MASVTPPLEISDTPWRQLWPRLCRRGWLKGSGTTIILSIPLDAVVEPDDEDIEDEDAPRTGSDPLNDPTSWGDQ